MYLRLDRVPALRLIFTPLGSEIFFLTFNIGTLHILNKIFESLCINSRFNSKCTLNYCYLPNIIFGNINNKTRVNKI